MKDRAGGIDGLKNWSGKCEGLGWGLDGLKNRSGKFIIVSVRYIVF